jgi:hypothetical protein
MDGQYLSITRSFMTLEQTNVIPDYNLGYHRLDRLRTFQSPAVMN